MVLIPDIRRQRHSLSDTRAGVFHNSYATQLGLRLKICESQKRQRVRQPPYSSINTASGVPVTTHNNEAHVRQMKHVAVSNPFIGSAREGLRNSPLPFVHRIANYSLVFSYNVRETFKTNEGVWKETTESPPIPKS